MTTNYTLFCNAYSSYFNDSVSDPDDAAWRSEFDQEVRYSASKKKVDTMALDAGQSRAITVAGGIALTDWHFIAIRCIGTGTLNTVGKDASAVGITAAVGMYGTDVFPGILLLSTYNLVSFTIASLADNSLFQLLDCTCVED